MGKNHPNVDPYIVSRVRALESLLLEKGILAPDAVDRVVQRYESDTGPMVGARAVARAWADPAYKRLLLENARAALPQFGLDYGMLVVAENTPAVHNLVVCTLCSCYPWPVLGLPPTWYKMPAYRSRAVSEPRAVLREFGLDIPPSREVRVWDSSAEMRYMVLPERPPGTEESRRGRSRAAHHARCLDRRRPRAGPPRPCAEPARRCTSGAATSSVALTGGSSMSRGRAATCSCARAAAAAGGPRTASRRCRPRRFTGSGSAGVCATWCTSPSADASGRARSPTWRCSSSTARRSGSTPSTPTRWPLALYDHVERMLEADACLPPPPALAAYHFTASAWQPRPDGQPVDDYRPRRRVDGEGHACAGMPSGMAADGRSLSVDRVVAAMQGAAGMPRKNGELVFEEPWQGRVFGMAVALHEQGLYEWEEFRQALIAQIAAAEARGGPFVYYEVWLATFEELLAKKGLVTPEELDETTYQFEFGERDEVY